jgi:type II secretion system protein H
MKSKGFTLIELMIVIVVMVIMAAIATPSYKSYMARSRLNGAANQLLRDLMSARLLAISQNNNVIVQITSSTGYKIVRDLNGNGVVDTGETGPVKSIRPHYYDVTFWSSVNPVFLTNGTVKAGSNATIYISNSTATKRVKVSSAGRIRII